MTERGRLVVGLQPVREAIRVHGARLGTVLIDRRSTPRLEALERFARDNGSADVRRVPAVELDREARGVTHQGVVAFGPELVLVTPETLFDDPRLLGVVLDRIQDPQNFGAVIRSAVALGGAAVMWGESASAPLGPATGRASAGAVEHARLCRVASLPDALREATDRGIQVVGLDASSETPIRDVALTEPTLLVVGSEDRGLGRAVRRACERLASVTARERIDSLNASVAAAVALYEAARQRASAR